MTRLPRRKAQQKSANETSLGFVLDKMGFKPLGRRVKIKPGVNQAKLRRPLSINTPGEPRD